MGYPGQDHRQVGDNFFFKKDLRGEDFFYNKIDDFAYEYCWRNKKWGESFSVKIRGAKTFFRLNKGGGAKLFSVDQPDLFKQSDLFFSFNQI